MHSGCLADASAANLTNNSEMLYKVVQDPNLLQHAESIRHLIWHPPSGLLGEHLWKPHGCFREKYYQSQGNQLNNDKRDYSSINMICGYTWGSHSF